MFLLSQMLFSLLFAALLGAAVGALLRGWRVKAKRADFQETLQAAESRHSEQLAIFSADQRHSLVTLDQARREVSHALELARADATGAQVRLAQREQQLQEISGALMRAKQELAQAEGVRRQLVQDKHMAQEEVEALRKQVVNTRAELAQTLGLHEAERVQWLEQLVAERQNVGTAERPVAVNVETVSPTAHAEVLQEREALMAQMQQMVALLQKAQGELEQRTQQLEALQPPAVQPQAPLRSDDEPPRWVA